MLMVLLGCGMMGFGIALSGSVICAVVDTVSAWSVGRGSLRGWLAWKDGCR
jgi:hypothetical protein